MNDELRARRQQIVDTHNGAEMAGDVDATIATFAPGRASYYVPSRDKTLDESEVRDYLTDFLTNMSDLDVETIAAHHADDAVILESRVSFTHTGEWNGIAPTGRRVTVRMCSVFRFDGDQLWQECTYRDNESIMRQILCQ